MRLENWFITNPDTAQQEVLKVPINQNLVVKGAAGSGKTNMAIYRASQVEDNSFVIVVYTIALEKMIRYGLSELGLDKDRVVHEWSWIYRGIGISGDLYCLSATNTIGLNRDLLILKTSDELRFFISKDIYEEVIAKGDFLSFFVSEVKSKIEVSVDFDDWVENKFYSTFLRSSRWFKEIEIKNFGFDLDDDNIVFIPAGYLFKRKGDVNYVIIDEGQDFSISTYKNHFLSEAKKSLTVFGDTSQKIYKDRFCNIEDIASELNYPLLNLGFNYRVPKTIAKIAQSIPRPAINLLDNNRKNNGNSDFPSYPKPIIKKCNSAEEELSYILNRIEIEGMDDVAILVPQENYVKTIHDFFSKNNVGTQVRIAIDIGTTPFGNRKFKRIDTLDFTNHDLPTILTYHSAKGTEFDNVFIPFAEMSMRLERNPFYVAVTRASNRVFITYTQKLTHLLDGVNNEDIILQKNG